ncbi:DnaJ-domain-containing protein [Bimuria novae-zelandiae CBS 107.79]|uniref:DnaJ-domain-containing protein n=1 Tax=Bimuria novae-zelandiae CBS 107.79 TaxID=1447943 RepID=A0A6A5UZ54_9PLEO|nr:DnaJ-domain-containing protein [Bimuria novae-zelandiae CBS 107.79]
MHLRKFSGRSNPRYAGYWCNFQHPIPISELRHLDYDVLEYNAGILEDCFLLFTCNNPHCGWDIMVDIDGSYNKTYDNFQYLISLGPPAKPVVVQQQMQAPVVHKKKVIERHLRPKVIKHQGEEHVHLPPQPVVQKKKIIERHLEPEITKHEEVEHVYIPDPGQRIEKRTYIHRGGNIHQSSTVEYTQDYAESSSRTSKRKTKYLRDKAERSEYSSDDARKGSGRDKGKAKRRGKDEYDDNRRSYSGKGKGKRKDDDYERAESSSHGRHDRKRSSSRSRERSRDRHESPRRPSPRRSSPRRDNHKKSSKKNSEKTTSRETQSYTHQEVVEGTYYGSDTNQSDHQVPATSSRRIESTPPISKEEKKPKGFDLYETLGLQGKRETADQLDIEAAYKALIRKWHPDRHMQKSKEEQDKATKRSSEITRAKDILGTPGRRAVYDRTGKTELWELDEIAERDAKNNQALVRPGKGGEKLGTEGKGLKNFFKKKKK